MNKALIGLSNNVLTNLQKIKVWAFSFKKYSQGNVYLLCANSTKEELGEVSKLGIKAVPVTVEDTWYINHKRLEHIHSLLQTLTEKHILVTDVFDVVFQNDPFKKLNFDAHDVFVGQEGVLINEEPWNSDNIHKIFPDEFLKCKSMPVVCSGIIAGKKSSLIPLYDLLFKTCERGTNEHNIKDQAALHVLIANNQIPNLKQFTLNDGWVMHCATSGPTPYFKGWGFEHALANKNLHTPLLENGVVKTNGQEYDIVHQFNRIPEWNKILTSKYE